jgi:hypothetical protein
MQIYNPLASAYMKTERLGEKITFFRAHRLNGTWEQVFSITEGQLEMLLMAVDKPTPRIK